MKYDMPAEERYRAPALDKGLDILELLATRSNALTRAEIVRAIDRSPSEIYRMLERLVARQYVSRTAEGDRYALTMKLFVLGSTYPPLRRLTAAAQPLLDDFSERTNQSVHLVMPDRGSGIVVARASGPANWEYHLRLGVQLDFLTTSSGKTLLAFQRQEHLSEVLAIWGASHIASDVAALEPELAAIREQGYRLGDSLQIAAVKDVSVPVFSPSGDAFAVVTCPYMLRVDKVTADLDVTLKALRMIGEVLSFTLIE